MSRGLVLTEELREKGRKLSAKRRQATAQKRAIEAKKMADMGMAVGKIAKQFGVTPRTISNDLKRVSE